MGQPSHIRLLPTHVANKIAAGEVVERPASVLKELLENAVDAGSRQIDVDVVDGGRKLVAVSDDGQGMNRDDALLSIERQATSKIRDVDDIERILTLGFRGEALAAIASVSRFRMVTCARGESVGSELLVTAGTLRDVNDAGCPAGTSIEVRDLFFNVPARRKFLRTAQTELGHLRSTFLLLALAHPEIGMSLTIDGRETYRLAGGSGDEPILEDRLRDLFGPDLLNKLCPVDGETADVRVKGYAGLPAIGRGDRGEQYIFVNGRATTAPVLQYAVREGYHTLLPRDRHPVLFLFITLDPGLVDVNVHPTKKEVRFRHTSAVRDAVISAIRKAIGRDDTRTAPPDIAGPRQVTARLVETPLQIDDLPAVRAFTYPRLAFVDEHQAKRTPAQMGGDVRDAATAVGDTSGDRLTTAGTSPWAWCRVLGQVGGLYVVLETEDGLVLMDPHAAHERVLFEQFTRAVTDGAVESQALLMPETVELNPKDGARVRRNLPVLIELGFGVAEFGADAFVVDAVPACFVHASPRDLLIEISAGLEQAGNRGGAGRWREEAIAQSACKAAVKARDRLTLAEIEKLVIDLARTEMPYTCPHGRPTVIFQGFRELHKKFGRE
jgi:DNA mismatch repair protein MutL